MLSKQIKMMAGMAVVLALAVQPAAAQTRFEWPDTSVNLARYTTPRQCLGAIDRIYRTLGANESRRVLRDTLPLNAQDLLAPTPTPIAEAARRCGERFAAVDSASLADFNFLLPLYL